MEVKEAQASATGLDRVTETRSAPSPRHLQDARWSYHLRGWLGLVPFLLFCLLFELLPAVVIIEGSFTNSATGAFTLDNYQRVFSQTQNLHAVQTSIILSLVTALVGAVFGFLAAYSLFSLSTGWLRRCLIGISGITANFAGVPLAFAFIATLGVNGWITVDIHKFLHVNLYDIGFNLYTSGGLVIVYSYFQLPLMMLLTIRALNRLRPEWREAAASLGASGFTYWRRVELPILVPSLIAATMLLFANAFGSYAAATALTQGAINLAPVLIGLAVTGNGAIDAGSVNALSVEMIVILLAAVWLAIPLLRRSAFGQVSDPLARVPDRWARRGLSLHKLLSIPVVLFLLIPLVALVVFAFPHGVKIDLSTYRQVFRDADFRQALFHSLELAFATTVCALVLVTPTAYWVHQRVPQSRPFIQFLTLVPFAVPAALLALGLVELYSTNNALASVLSFGLVPLFSSAPFHIVNTPQLLVCAYVMLSLPFVYRIIEGSLRAINATVLTEAACSLGSGWWRAFLSVILPNIWPGVMSAALLTFSLVMGEFTLASLFGLFTFPVYLNAIGQERIHEAAFLAIVSLLFTLLCVLGVIFLLRPGARRPRVEGGIDVVATK